MRIERLDINGWMPFRGQFSLLLPAGPIALVGVHDDDPERSNGSGKSSIMQAIRWCLSGDHDKRLDDDVINRQADATIVRICFSTGCVVQRSRKRGGPTELEVSDGGVTYRKKDAQDALDRIVGLTMDDMLATFFVQQGDVEALVTRTSGERRQHVAGWLKLDGWGSAAKVARMKLRSVAERLQMERLRLRTASEATLPSDDIAGLTESADSEDAKSTEQERQADALVARAERAKHVATRRAARERRVGLVEKAKQQKELGRQQGAALREHDSAALAWQRAENDVAVAFQEVTEASRLVTQGFTGRCPVMCAPCPVADVVAQETDAHQSRNDRAVEAWRDKKSAAKQAEASAAAASRRAREAREAALAYGQTKEAIKAIDEMVPDEGVPEDEAVLKADMQQLRWAAQAGRQQAAAIRARVQQAEKAAEQVELHQEEVAMLERALRVAQLALRCLSTVPNRIAETRIVQLEERANALLSEHRLHLRIVWDRPTKELAGRCVSCGEAFAGKAVKACPTCGEARGLGRREELDLLVDDGSGEEDARQASGGRRVMIGSALRFAAGAMLRAERGSQAAFALIDEPFGQLDVFNRTELVKRFAWLLSASGLEQAIVIAHHADILDALPHRMVVRRTGNRESSVGLEW